MFTQCAKNNLANRTFGINDIQLNNHKYSLLLLEGSNHKICYKKNNHKCLGVLSVETLQNLLYDLIVSSKLSIIYIDLPLYLRLCYES